MAAVPTALSFLRADDSLRLCPTSLPFVVESEAGGRYMHVMYFHNEQQPGGFCSVASRNEKWTAQPQKIIIKVLYVMCMYLF